MVFSLIKISLSKPVFDDVILAWIMLSVKLKNLSDKMGRVYETANPCKHWIVKKLTQNLRFVGQMFRFMKKGVENTRFFGGRFLAVLCYILLFD